MNLHQWRVIAKKFHQSIQWLVVRNKIELIVVLVCVSALGDDVLKLGGETVLINFTTIL